MHHEPLNSWNAVWDDGEWISWDEINRHLAESDLEEPEPRYSAGYDDYEEARPKS